MFKRSRRKIILSIMLPLFLLFVITLTVILLASWQEIERHNEDLLRRYIDMYTPEQKSGSPDRPPDGKLPKDEKKPPAWKQPPDASPDFQLATFYSVAVAEDGTVLTVDDGDREVYGEDELIQLARELLSGRKRSGRTGSLTYRISEQDGYTLVAFLDNTVTQSSMDALLHNILIAGGAAIVILFFLSLLLSKRIIRPLEENDQKQKQFISDASHELKTPITVIGTSAELLSQELGENEWLGNIQYENKRMGELVKQLLDLSRAENAEMPMEPVDFSRIVIGEALALEGVAFDQGKTIREQIAADIHVLGNRSQLTQLVCILLDNAIKHSSGSEIGVSLTQRGHTAELSVVNDGAEIPQEKLTHLFDRFYRADEARGNEGGHYGLGLSIAKAVAEKHGGRIDVSCQDGTVRFSVHLSVK